MGNKTNNHVRINLDIMTNALENAVNELETVQDKLAQVEGELAQAKADLARFDKIREQDFDYLLREYAYNVWSGNDAAAVTISDVISVMYYRGVCAYKAPNSDHLLIEVRECMTMDCKPIMYFHWDADEPFARPFTEKVYVK